MSFFFFFWLHMVHLFCLSCWNVPNHDTNLVEFWIIMIHLRRKGGILFIKSHPMLKKKIYYKSSTLHITHKTKITGLFALTLHIWFHLIQPCVIIDTTYCKLKKQLKYHPLMYAIRQVENLFSSCSCLIFTEFTTNNCIYNYKGLLVIKNSTSSTCDWFVM